MMTAYFVKLAQISEVHPKKVSIKPLTECFQVTIIISVGKAKSPTSPKGKGVKIMANNKLIEQWKRDSLTLSLVIAVLKRDIKGIEDDSMASHCVEDNETLFQEKRILELLTDDEYLADYARLVLVEDVD